VKSILTKERLGKVFKKLNPPKRPEFVFVFTPIPQDEFCVLLAFFWGVADFLWPIPKKGIPKIIHKKKNLAM
jgi:hypothetical protein